MTEKILTTKKQGMAMLIGIILLYIAATVALIFSLEAGILAVTIPMFVILCLGWILISALFTDKMEMLRDKIAGGNMDAIQALTAGGGVGGFAYMVAQRCIPFNPMSSNLWAVVASAVFTVWLNTYMKKNPTAKWAQQFGMTISMFFGMAVGAIAIFVA